MENSPLHKPQDYSQYNVVLFDGVCNLCNGAVQFIIARDKQDYFHFTSLQSPIGQDLLKDEDLSGIDSIIFVEKGKKYYYSTAILHICKHLSGLYPLLFVFIIVPAFIRDGIYKFVAKNRYKWFGKKNEDFCLMPTPELEKKLLK